VPERVVEAVDHPRPQVACRRPEESTKRCGASGRVHITRQLRRIQLCGDRSIDLTSIGSNFCEGGEEILKEVPQLEGVLESKTGRKRKLHGKDIASKPGVEARESPFDPSPLGGSIPLGCAEQEERAACC
jgi:hypothetical protein